MPGPLDVQRVLYNLHRRYLPIELLRAKAQEYVGAGLIEEGQALNMISAIEAERGADALVNDNVVDAEEDLAGASDGCPFAKLSLEQMQELLHRRERLMQGGGDAVGDTDQWRVYQHIVESIAGGSYLRLMVQASAGTGKSFLLTTVYLWCIINKRACRAACPTGIAASNIEIDGTSVSACTLHSMFELETDADGTRSNLDFSKPGAEKVGTVLSMEVLLLDEVRQHAIVS